MGDMRTRKVRHKGTKIITTSSKVRQTIRELCKISSILDEMVVHLYTDIDIVRFVL